MGLKVLLTNNTLAERAGSELYVRDVALGLQRRGHAPVAFSTVLGDVAAEMRAATIPVVDRLEAIGSDPDVIHGHHHLETMLASLRFPNVPVVHFCHGWLPWEEIPAKAPSIYRHVAVDDVCHDRLRFEHGIPEERIVVLRNFVDLARFRPGPPRAARPRRALVFSNQAREATYLPLIREACERRGIAMDVAGHGSGRVVPNPESILGEYDLVFAKARAAMEAMATGCAVVLCDGAGLGPLVRSDRFHELFALNFGIRTLSGTLDAGAVGRAIDSYDAADAARVGALMREHGDLEQRLDSLVALYESALGWRPEATPQAVGRAASEYLQWLSPKLKGIGNAALQLSRATEDCRAMEARCRALEDGAAVSRSEQSRQASEALEACRTLTRDAEVRAAQAVEARDRALAEVERLNRFVVMRFRRFVHSLPVVGRLTRGLVRAAFYRTPPR